MAAHQRAQMRDHLVAIQEVVAAVAAEDWGAVAEAAARLGSSPERDRMCSHMGEGAEGFAEQAIAFHRRADGIGSAAADADGAAVLRATAHTLEACTGCHAGWRQRIVDP